MQCCQQGDQQQIDFCPNELPSDHPVWPPDLDTSSSDTGTSTTAWSEQVQQCQVLDQKLMEHIPERPKRWNQLECKKGDETWLTRKRNPWRRWQLAWTKYHTYIPRGGGWYLCIKGPHHAAGAKAVQHLDNSQHAWSGTDSLEWCGQLCCLLCWVFNFEWSPVLLLTIMWRQLDTQLLDHEKLPILGKKPSRSCHGQGCEGKAGVSRQ